MSGPEHYREAERLLALALKHQEKGLVPRAVDICNTQAQVHATLALAAATVGASAALGEMVLREGTDMFAPWWEATS